MVFLSAIKSGNGPDGFTAAVVLDADGRDSSFLDDDYFALLARVAEGKSIAIVWNGNQQNADFLVESSPAFRVFRAGISNSGTGGWLPRQVLREYWKPSFGQLWAALPLLTSVATVYLIGTPPPKSQTTLRSFIQRDPYFLERAAQLGMDITELKVTEFSTRLAMWEILQEMLKESAERFGAVFIPVPDDVMDSEGAMLRQYCRDDATHANSQYGARLWKEVATTMRKNGSAS